MYIDRIGWEKNKMFGYDGEEWERMGTNGYKLIVLGRTGYYGNLCFC